MGSEKAMSEGEEMKKQTYDNRKWLQIGVQVGIHAQELIVGNTSLKTGGGIGFAEIPGYSPGFSIDGIGGVYLNPYFNLRLTPTINFGDRKFMFRRWDIETDETFSTTVRSNYLTFPLTVKYSAFRVNNYRPYISGGIYTAFDLGRKKGNPILLKGTDFGLEFGLGCDIYLPYFKLCPELKFSFGLVNLLEKDRPDITDPTIIKYPNALSRATSRMVSLIFNFE